MADIKISDLASNSTVATGDLVPCVDVSDTSQGPAGSTKKMTVAQLKTGIGVPAQAYTAATGLTATGTNQGTALALTAETNDVTTVAANTGVVLAAYTATGVRQTVRNRGANPLNVYPPSSTAINALGNNTAFVLPAGSAMTFVWVSSTLCITTALLVGAAMVDTAETQTAGAGYANLATTGPAVTLATGTLVLVMLTASCLRSAAGNSASMSVAVSGATTTAASDANGAIVQSAGSGFNTLSRMVLLTVTAGINTFTASYKNDGGSTWTFSKRAITVIPIN